MSCSVSSSHRIEQNTASTLTFQVRSNEELCEGNGQERHQVCFPSGDDSMDKHGETQGWYIWQLSNKWTHEGPNVWWNTEWNLTVCLAVIEVSSYKLLFYTFQELVS